MRKNLVVAAHADDEVMGHGGTIARHVVEARIASSTELPTPHPCLRNRPQIADQIDIGGGRSAFKLGKGAIPLIPTDCC